MGDATPPPGQDEQRERLIALLQSRAQLLRPSDELVGRALRRCIRHQLRFQKKPAGPPDPSQIAATLVTPASGHDIIGGASYAPSEQPGMPGALEPRGDRTPPVPAAVAMAVTMSDSRASHHPTTDKPVTGRFAVLSPGREIAGYRIEGHIGSGGMGQVYRATQLSMNRVVALKILSPRLSANRRFRERFLREARAAGRLHHPNLISVHDVGDADGMMFFSMELVEGTSVKEAINELGTLPEDRALDITRQTLRALRYAHEHGIIHRDIKPDNLMITTSGLVKVADLGLSKVDAPLEGEEDQFTTQAGIMMGTPYYMPPEQGRDAHRADERADVYSVGATLYHMLCGQVPFVGETPVAILINASTQPLAFPEPGPSAVMRQVIEALMAKKAGDRPRSAIEALELIDRLTSGGVAMPLREATTSARVSERRSNRISNRQFAPHSSRSRRRSRRYSTASALVVAVVLAVLVAALALRGGRDPAARARVLAERQQFQAAMDELAAARHGGGDPRLDAVGDDIGRQWDAWAEPRARDALAAVDRAIAAGDAKAATAALASVPETWKSPRVRDACDERRRALERAPAAGRYDAPQVAVARWWRGALTGVAGVHDEAATFTGDGGAELGDLPKGGDGLLPVALRVRLAGDGESSTAERWTLLLGGDRRLSVRASGLVLQDGDRPPRALATPDREGWVAFTLSRDAGGWLLRVGAAAHRLPDGGEARPALQWRLPDARHAEVALVADR